MGMVAVVDIIILGIGLSHVHFSIPLVFLYTRDATSSAESVFKLKALEALEASKSTWPARKQVVACVTVCKSRRAMIVEFVYKCTEKHAREVRDG